MRGRPMAAAGGPCGHGCFGVSGFRGFWGFRGFEGCFGLSGQGFRGFWGTPGLRVVVLRLLRGSPQTLNPKP